jgi:hypothetical protein
MAQLEKVLCTGKAHIAGWDGAQVLADAAHQTGRYSKAIRGNIDFAINLV